MVKGNPKEAGKDAGTRWNDSAVLKAFCEACAEQALQGNKCKGYLTIDGVDAVMTKLGEVGKLVSPQQIKTKWDHLRRLWKLWRQLVEQKSVTHYDDATGKIEARDEWWDRKIKEWPEAKTIRAKGLLHVDMLDIMYLANNDGAEGSEDSSDSKEFFDPQCHAHGDVDPMEEGQPSFSRSKPTMNKGKGLATNVQLKRVVHKRRSTRNSVSQEVSDSLMSITKAILESRSVNPTPLVGAPPSDVKQVMDRVLTLPGVKVGDRIHVFSSMFFMGHPERTEMFLALPTNNKTFQLRWLEIQYDTNRKLWFPYR